MVQVSQEQQFTGFSQSIYELITQRAPLDVVLDAINSAMETQFPDALVSVMLYEPSDNTLNLIAGSGLSEEYRAAMQGIAVEADKGACGTAAYYQKLAICDNIAEDPRWDGFKDLAAREHLKSCWSAPLVDANGDLLGTFATYYRKPKTPTDEEIKLIRRAAGLGVLAITHLREVQRRESTEEQLHLLERSIESSANGVVMVDAQDPTHPMVYANQAFEAITGYTREEAMGRNCSFLQGRDTDPQAVGAIRRALQLQKRIETTVLNYRKDGTAFWNKLQIEPVLNHAGECTHFVGTQQDVTRERENERLLDQYASHDLLTGLPNRTLFDVALARACQRAELKDQRVTVLLIDLDDFKPVNNSLGHGFGDQVLITVAERLKEIVGDKGFLSRVGGDEFAVLLGADCPESEVISCATAILTGLSRPFEIQGHRLHISASAGIASQHHRLLRPEELMSYADAAVDDAKSQGRNTWHWHEGFSAAISNDYVVLRRELMEAIEQDQFVLFYQPIVDSGSGKTELVEALIRWKHPEKGFVSPGEFIPLAEQTGQIVAIGQWVLQKACSDIARWNKGCATPTPVSVNISPLQFRRFGFLDELSRALDTSGLDPELLELEVTENVLMSGTEQAIDTLREIRRIGVRVSIDDFGTGYSSLRYLRQLPISKVKLDRSFIFDITENPDNAAIVQGVITMAHHLGLVVVGEGVETREQADDLHRRGCDLLQGFLYSRPVPLAELPAPEQSSSGVETER